MTQPVQKKKRTLTALPPAVNNVVLAEQNLQTLVEMQEEWKQAISGVPQKILELRAINAEIRRKAR